MQLSMVLDSAIYAKTSFADDAQKHEEYHIISRWYIRAIL